MARGDFAGAAAAAQPAERRGPPSAGWLLGSFAALCDGKDESCAGARRRSVSPAPPTMRSFFFSRPNPCAPSGGPRRPFRRPPSSGGPRTPVSRLWTPRHFLENARAIRKHSRCTMARSKPTRKLFGMGSTRSEYTASSGNFDLAARDYRVRARLCAAGPGRIERLVDLRPNPRSAIACCDPDGARRRAAGIRRSGRPALCAREIP